LRKKQIGDETKGRKVSKRKPTEKKGGLGGIREKVKKADRKFPWAPEKREGKGGGNPGPKVGTEKGKRNNSKT